MKRPGVVRLPPLVWDRTPQPKHVGLALGGGAARGLAHIGALEVLEEEGIPVHIVVGCSVGALVGALWTAGVAAQRQHELVTDMHWSTISSLGLRLPKLTQLGTALKGLPLGILDLDRLMEWMEEIFAQPLTFADLNLPFAAIATDIVTGELVIMNEGAICPAVRASCSVPGIFTPYRRNGRLLVDGGVISNLPVQIARQMGAEYVIAVDLLPVPGQKRREPENIVDLALTSLYTLIRANQGQERHADCLIAPDLDAFSLVDLGASAELIEAGRAAAKEALPQIKHELALPAEKSPSASL